MLKTTLYDVESDVDSLRSEINSFVGIARLPLGKYESNKQVFFCYLHFNDMLLPADMPRGPACQGESYLTHIKCHPSTDVLPKEVIQIGELYLSKTPDRAKARPSSFVVAVTPARKVFAIYNPLGPDPKYICDDEGVEPMAYKSRPTRRALGF